MPGWNKRFPSLTAKKFTFKVISLACFSCACNTQKSGTFPEGVQAGQQCKLSSSHKDDKLAWRKQDLGNKPVKQPVDALTTGDKPSSFLELLRR